MRNPQENRPTLSAKSCGAWCRYAQRGANSPMSRLEKRREIVIEILCETWTIWSKITHLFFGVMFQSVHHEIAYRPVEPSPGTIPAPPVNPPA
jgi:hypothetical protein